MLQNSAIAATSGISAILFNNGLKNRTIEQVQQKAVGKGGAIKLEALYDDLTGTASRELLTDHYALERAQADRNRTKISMISLSIDDLGLSAETSSAGSRDQLVRQIADRLKACVRGSDTIARTADNEFMILLPGLIEPEYATAIIKKIRFELRRPFLINEQPVSPSVSTGISIYPDDGQDFETLLGYAGIARRQAIEEGPNANRFYSTAVQSRSVERLKLESRLEQAVERGELRVFYQARIDLDTRRLVCVEALLRWQHPELGLIRPGQFMRVAEETGLILPIGEWIMRAACRQNLEWQADGYPPSCMSINLSTRQFRQKDLLQRTMNVLEEFKLDPQWLEFEITEATAMRDMEATVSSMRKMTEQGIKFSLDDFGTGASSLNYLKQLPVHRVKIDGPFIENIPHDPENRAIVRAIIAMAHSLRLKTIAEGVETERQVAFLRSNRCDEMQGNLVHPPMSPEKFIDALKLHR